MLDVLDRVRTQNAYANLVLPAAIRRAGLGPADTALATELTYGTLRRLGTLDWVVSLYSTRPVSDLDPPVLDALRLGVYQLLYSNVPTYAAVSATVEAMSRKGPQGFVNAVLRKISSSRDDLPWPTRHGDMASYLEIVTSHPGWMVRMWLDEMGEAETEALCESGNLPPAVGVRVHGSDPSMVANELRDHGLQVQPGRWAPDALVITGGGSPVAWPGFDEGRLAVQDEASILVARALDVQAHETVADLCAGPGGKAVHVAYEGARTVAVELHHPRAVLVSRTAARLGVETSRLISVQGDARRPPVRPGLDAVLIDAPCSGLGVLRRRPEARWRIRPEQIGQLADLQMELVTAGLGLVRPGGRLLYAVCTVTRAETVDVVERVLEHHPHVTAEEVHPDIPRPRWRPMPGLQLVPHMHSTDGMYMVSLRVGT